MIKDRITNCAYEYTYACERNVQLKENEIMLKKIPSILPPELVKTMMEMGHGDEILLADGNFPCNEFGRKVIRMDGHNIPEVLEAILKYLPLDPYVDQPVALMEVVPGDNVKTPIWDEYKNIIKKSEEANRIGNGFAHVERFEYYERAKNAFVIIATSEPALYANIILKKGVVI